MAKANAVAKEPRVLALGDNPVNAFHAREYAKESSPGIINVLLELTENARDNATDVTLTLDVEKMTDRLITPKAIICEDNGTGLTHHEFLNRFCGAFWESEVHHDADRAGRNGVGTKTYTSIAERVLVTTTTGRPTEGLDVHRDIIEKALPAGMKLPADGEPDTLWRAYEFLLHKRGAVPEGWKPAKELEMGSRVELLNLRPGTEVNYDTLVERLSYAREWLRNGAHRLTLQLVGNVPANVKRKIEIKPWNLPTKDWLVSAIGRSDQPLKFMDPTTKENVSIAPARLSDPLSFDFRVVGKTAEGHMQNLDSPALLVEVSGALPYAPNLDGTVSARTLPLLSFVGLEHASSIGAFCNAVSGWGHVNSLTLKQALRNNKTTLASGPGTDEVQELRRYLHSIFQALHRAWYNATRAGQEEATRDAINEAAVEVNLALTGANRNPFKSGDIHRGPKDTKRPPQPPTRRHRWECGACSKRWLADAGFTPKRCAEQSNSSGVQDGCGSTNIGLAKNQPRIGDCQIRIEQFGDSRVPASFQFEKQDGEDEDTPVVLVNLLAPRYVELRGAGSMSGQAQRRLKQYLVDIALTSIAEYHAKVKGTDFAQELGDLYFNRMLRYTGIRDYESQVSKLLKETTAKEEQTLLDTAA